MVHSFLSALILFAASRTAEGFLKIPHTNNQIAIGGRDRIIRNGFFDSMFGGGQDDAWKDAELLEQQKILARRQKGAGYLTEEDEEEIFQRRNELNREAKVLKDIQSRDDIGKIEDWQKLRAEGKIQTPTSGLERDQGSERLGSEGLFEERVDLKMPFVDQGYVDEDADVMGKITSFFGGKGKKED